MKKNTRLRIGFVLDDGLDKPDGVQQNILTLGSWLTLQGHDVYYIVGETFRTDLANVIILSKNIKVNFNGNSLTIPLLSSSKKITDTVNKKFDIIHVQVPYSPLMSARLINRLDEKTKVIGTFHILPTGKISYFGTKLLGIWLIRNLKKFDKHLAVSPPAKDFAQQTFNIKCEVLPNPVDLDKYRPSDIVKKNDDVVKLLFVGRLVSRKGCKYLLEAINKIVIENNTKNAFHLDICGDGLLRKNLEAYVAKNNLNNYVTFHGFVDEDKKILMMQRADISIFPSVSGESFGIVLLEAMAAGGIVLGGNNPGYSTILSKSTESLIDVKDIDKFSLKLANLISSRIDRQRIYRSQQELVKQYDVNVVGKNLLAIYKDCIS